MAEKEINEITDEATTLTDDAYMVADNDMVGTPITVKILWSNIKAMLALLFAPIAKGVTNGDSHNHLGGDGGTIAHTSLNAVTTDQHHAQSHTVASHSDTTATGAELDTLTDGSNADTLHTHSVGGTSVLEVQVFS